MTQGREQQPLSAAGAELALPITRAPEEAAGLTLADVLVALLSRWRPLLVVPLCVAIVGGAASFLISNRYTASIGLVPEPKTGSPAGQLAGLAALAGVNLGTLGTSESPQFYAAILQSRPIGYVVLERHYATAGLGGDIEHSDSATLVDILKTKGQTPALRLWRAYRRLQTHMLDVRVDLRSGIIHLSVRHTSARLAADIANAFAEELLRFNAETRETMAGKRRRFVEGRTAEASADLAAAEGAVRDFLDRNRQYDNSPSLRFEFSRLQRNLTVQQELYLDLRRQLDNARIAEVDDVPALTIVENAIPPQRKSFPPRALITAALFLVTFFLVALRIIGQEYGEQLFPGFATRLAEVGPTLPPFARRWLSSGGPSRRGR